MVRSKSDIGCGERTALEKAFSAGGSIKLTAKDSVIRGDPGYGYSNIVQSLRSLCAYSSVRTGRLLATFDGTTPPTAVSANTLFVQKGAVGQGYAPIPGTIIQTLIPIGREVTPQQRLL